jgi:hypothetical protein
MMVSPSAAMTAERSTVVAACPWTCPVLIPARVVGMAAAPIPVVFRKSLLDTSFFMVDLSCF